MKDLAGLLNLWSLNTITFRLLSGNSYMNLPVLLKRPIKGLIKSKNKHRKCFYGVMLDILILQKSIQKELKKTDKKN